MSDQKTPAELADVAAEAIRALNHLTQHADSLPYPGDAYSTVANLAVLARRLPQGIDQITAVVQALYSSNNLRSDRPDVTVDQAVTTVVQALAAADTAAKALEIALDAAHQALGPLAYQES